MKILKDNETVAVVACPLRRAIEEAIRVWSRRGFSDTQRFAWSDFQNSKRACSGIQHGGRAHVDYDEPDRFLPQQVADVLLGQVLFDTLTELAVVTPHC
ncbi:hypothetical protein [Ensifer sp. B1-9]|uniref:hypothetical protein n=1 Tax=Ensifer sp. B1-9 TaxID=3141455 RepID=UPI003D1A8100